jgi:hypothetical protein
VVEVGLPAAADDAMMVQNIPQVLMRFGHPLLGLVYSASGASCAAAALVCGDMDRILPTGSKGV